MAFQIKKLHFKHVQVIIWILITALYFIYKFQGGDPFWQSLNFGFNKTLSYVFVLYGNALWLIPYFYKKERYLIYFLLSLALISFVTYLSIHEICFGIRYFGDGSSSANESLSFMNYGSIFISLVLVFIFSFSYRYVLDFFYLSHQQEILQKQHAEAQLSLLKAQVQPHFLFNTLNNIYYVAQLESPLTADMVEKLSNIMRYFLEEGPQKLVTIGTELNFIMNYIDLEKIRMRYPIKVTVYFDEQETGEIRIPPMLLIPLVENVFKHGIDKTIRDNFTIIEIGKSGNKFTFRVTNNSCEQRTSESNHITGTGLKNLKNRLAMLYEKDFTLKTFNEDGVFVSELIIPV
jgi:sensor histidine kinase YesM